MTITQNDLKERVKKFVTNGKHVNCQAVLNSIGYDESQLAAGEALLDTWLGFKEQVKGLSEIKKLATKAEKVAKRSAQLEATALREAVRALWSDDDKTMALFDLVNYRRVGSRPGETTNGQANGNSPADEIPTNGSNGNHPNGRGWVSDYQLNTAECIARWRVLFAMTGKLDEDKQAKLAEFGWDGGHIDEALELVEEYAQADATQQKKIKDIEAGRASAKQAEKELRRWYAQASRLTRSAIKRHVPPEQQQYLRDLLGL